LISINFYRSHRFSGEFLYFSKHPRELDAALYASSAAPRYAFDAGFIYPQHPNTDSP